MITLHYRTSLFTLILDGKAIDRAEFIIDDYQRHSLLAIPMEECDVRLPTCGAIQTNSLRTISLTSNFDSIDLGNGDYELLPLFPLLPRGYQPKVIMQREGDGILATIYQDYGSHILIEDDSAFINHALPLEVDDIKIGYCEAGGLIIAYGKQYIAVFVRDNEDFKLLLEKGGGIPNIKQDVIEIVYDRCDMLRRQVVESYAMTSGTYSLVSRKFTHTLHHKYIAELLPCLLVDALIAEDYDFARSLLAPDLAQNILAVRDFFGEIISFYSIKGQPIGNKSLTLLVNNSGRKAVKRYNFDYNNTHILDFSEAE